jgi:hypothetical protein
MNRQQQIEHFVAQAHALAMQRLLASPARVSEVQLQLSRCRAKAPDSRSDVYWNEWEQLLRGCMQNLAAQVCADTDHAALLRSVSPMSVLITQTERAAFIRQARQLA